MQETDLGFRVTKGSRPIDSGCNFMAEVSKGAFAWALPSRPVDDISSHSSRKRHAYLMHDGGFADSGGWALRKDAVHMPISGPAGPTASRQSLVSNMGNDRQDINVDES